MPFFKVIGTDKKTKARAGILKTSHGQIQTPVFVPVGTQGTVKSLTCDDLGNLGVQIFLANTYHLYLRPGVETIEKLGGLHNFVGWEKPLMSDSGGFQIFSLSDVRANDVYAGPAARHLAGARSANPPTGGLRASKVYPRPELGSKAGSRHPQGSLEPSLVAIDDNGVTFRSHLDGSTHRFTPEISIEIQKKLGADIILAFDQCPPYGVGKEVVKRATERTHQWAVRGLKAKAAGPAALHPHPTSSSGFAGHAGARWGSPARVTRRLETSQQTLFGIIQGGVFKDLREESAKFISSMEFAGIAIGGVAVGESKKEMVQVLDWVVPHLPDDKPRHLLGVGEIDDIFEAVARGIDSFDCVMPTRLGRMGHTLVKSPASGEARQRRQKLKVKSFTMDITKAVFARDPRPLEEGCGCYTCQNYSRAYLNHLFRARELLAYRLVTYHNLYFMTGLMRQIREAILNQEFEKLKKGWI